MLQEGTLGERHLHDNEAGRLATVLERTWDGEWHRRGYYDDGTPLGSAQNDECKIDSIAQSWAVLSGAVPSRHADPPSSWPEYEIAWRFGRTRYEIAVSNPDRRCRGVAGAELARRGS